MPTRHHSARLRIGGVAAAMLATALIASGVAGSASAAGSTSAAVPAISAAVPEYPRVDVGPERDPAKRDIVVIDAGGTITSGARDRISYQHYQGSVSGGVETILNDMYPELAPVANLSVVKATGLGRSSSVQTASLYNLSRIIDQYLADDEVDGVVITSGTNILEEAAYFFDLTVRSPKPVVVTGAMHQYGTFTYDGYTNLFSSIRLAASGKTTCFGTVVLLNDQFFAGRDATKADGYRMDTFDARLYGQLGVVNEDKIFPMRAPSRVLDCGTDRWTTPFDLTEISAADLPKVDIATGYIESSAATIEGPVAAGAKGIVTAGHGSGGISSVQGAAQQTAVANGVVFVTTTRSGGQGEYDGGAPGVIGGGDLLPQKARILLQLGLAFTTDSEQIRAWFATVGNPEFDLSAALAAPEPEPEPEQTASPVPEPSDGASPAPTDQPSAEPSETPAAGAAAGAGGGPLDGSLAITGGGGVGLAILAALAAAAAGTALYIRHRRRIIAGGHLIH